MNTPNYWAKAAVDQDGQETGLDDAQSFIGVGWSDIDQSDAYRHALERARNIARRFADEGFIEQIQEQYYTDRPLREPVIDELTHDGRRIAAVTQNIYGAYVLNASEALFIDIDLPAPPKPPGFIARLLGAKPPPIADENAPLDEVRRAIAQHPGLGLKVYRTPNGLRALVTSATYQPKSPEAEALLQAFKSDELYATLCRAQECFRARLTPKPWRIGMDCPPRTFPFSEPGKAAAFDLWKSAYDKRSADYAACEPLSDAPWGNTTVHPDIQPVLTMHDQLACSPGRPLA